MFLVAGSILDPVWFLVIPVRRPMRFNAFCVFFFFWYFPGRQSHAEGSLSFEGSCSALSFLSYQDLQLWRYDADSEKICRYNTRCANARDTKPGIYMKPHIHLHLPYVPT